MVPTPTPWLFSFILLVVVGFLLYFVLMLLTTKTLSSGRVKRYMLPNPNCMCACILNADILEKKMEVLHSHSEFRTNEYQIFLKFE